ncbi:antibiotic biosynthesis monooxygenase [Leisingera caerulea]|uniref:antibiotic biosynthesis monooxygenase n=1 Tax=Leisingera caerulea TaxID=506591 RepID=UPI0004071E07|nr:antibiotic biosynthesis monooxygenase [Leisingera caerulea]UWQ51285.1 antibiotic biosynthesis monooxygenase [Leisingera caerulea]UWQ85078.1 antibiotic biosynthesis monooxygenase [Leisingera caerulea]
MKEAAIAVIYPDIDTFEDHAKAVAAMICETRRFPGCIEAHAGINRERHEIAVFHFWESNDHLDRYLTWRAERGDLDARSATMRREQDFRTFSVP